MALDDGRLERDALRGEPRIGISRGGGRLIDEAAMPQLQDQQAEDFLREEAGAEVREKEALDGRFVEEAAGDGFLVKKDGASPALEIAPEPERVGHGKAGFLALDDFSRNARGEGALGDVLGNESVDFKI